jgi:hypothetical protein
MSRTFKDNRALRTSRKEIDGGKTVTPYKRSSSHKLKGLRKSWRVS